MKQLTDAAYLESQSATLGIVLDLRHKLGEDIEKLYEKGENMEIKGPKEFLAGIQKKIGLRLFSIAREGQFGQGIMHLGGICRAETQRIIGALEKVLLGQGLETSVRESYHDFLQNDVGATPILAPV